MDTEPAVGSRLLVGKHGATIRYLGPVEGQDGVWAGLEWDDPTRGKHDGSHSGTRYFSCLRHTQPGATAGSFVRLPKLITTADLGQSLETAIQSRYKIQTDESNNIIEDYEVDNEAYVPTASNRRVQIHLVGAAAMAAKVSQDGALQHASFIDQRISRLTLTRDMGIPFLKNVATLDLSNNLIGSWLAVTELLSNLPKLHTLNLSGNLIDIDIDTSTRSTILLPSLKTLVLNSCGITWPHVLSLSMCLPHLTALHLCRNNISNLDTSGVLEYERDKNEENSMDGMLLTRCFPELETLDLEENLLSNWNELSSQLHALPKLKSLLLSGNSFKEITYPYKIMDTSDNIRGVSGDGSSSFNGDTFLAANNSINSGGGGGKDASIIDKTATGGAAGGGFSSLEHLMLGSNHLSNCRVADELDKFPNLIDLRISNNPLTAPSAGAAPSVFPVRYELIARISKLQMLNGSDIRAGERQDAELAYLRLVTDEVAEARAADILKKKEGITAKEENNAEAAVALVLERHPKFSYLIAKYGELTASRTSSTQGTTLASSMVELIFISGAKTVKKKVPTTLTIGRLKPLLERVLKIKLGHQCITLVDPFQSSNNEDVTSQDGKELGFYGITDGWRVEVGVRDVAAVVAAKDALVAEQEKRMEEHERGLQRLRAEEERLMVG